MQQTTVTEEYDVGVRIGVVSLEEGDYIGSPSSNDPIIDAGSSVHLKPRI